eukprot:GHVT01008806.1.p1 GENE.GHVT01008806.1~~GHVT01008806.1.p1  ORF type:complete len:137 (-),score=21.68 GHVT01008806.1:84-494(-)
MELFLAIGVALGSGRSSDTKLENHKTSAIPAAVPSASTSTHTCGNRTGAVTNSHHRKRAVPVTSSCCGSADETHGLKVSRRFGRAKEGRRRRLAALVSLATYSALVDAQPQPTQVRLGLSHTQAEMALRCARVSRY